MNLHYLRPHARNRQRIGPYAEGSLNAKERTAFGAHLSSCTACAAQLEETQALRTALRTLPDPAVPRSFRLSPPMLQVAAPLVTVVPRRASRLTVMSGARLAASAAAVALAVALIVDVVPRGEGDESSVAAPASDLEASASTKNTAGGATAATPNAASPAPRAASAPSADTGAISGAGSEAISSPPREAVQDSASQAPAPPAPPADFGDRAGEVATPGGDGAWRPIRIVQLVLAATLFLAVAAMLSTRARRSAS